MKNYVLMHKDKEVAKINICDRGIKLLSIIRNDFLPIGISEHRDKTLDEQITIWNGNRCIPLGRPNYQKLMHRVSVNQASDWIAKSYMCSLTDCYWFKPEYSSISWRDVNFRDNGFSSNLYKALFYGDDNAPIKHFHSPELTTNGAEPKIWLEKEDGFYLLKHYSDTKPTTVCNEFIASKIFSLMGIDCVDYNLTEFDGKIWCESKCFIASNNEEFVTADDLMNAYGYSMPDIKDLMIKLGFESEIEKMIVCDYMVGNSDRHAGNFGVIIDSETREIKRFAPLFDHGESYIYENMDHLFYIVGETTFGDAICDVNLSALSMIDSIKQQDVIDILSGVPYMNSNTKNEIFAEFFNRINRVQEIIIERGIECERDR